MHAVTKTCVPIFFGFMLQPCIAKHLSPAQTGRGADTAEEGGLMKCPPLLSSFRNNSFTTRWMRYLHFHTGRKMWQALRHLNSITPKNAQNQMLVRTRH